MSTQQTYVHCASVLFVFMSSFLKSTLVRALRKFMTCTYYIAVKKAMAYTFISVLHVYCSLLLHRWERLRSIVMSMSVCLSVCEDISGTTSAILTKDF